MPTDFVINLKGDQQIRERLIGGKFARIATESYTRRVGNLLRRTLYAESPKDTEALAKSWAVSTTIKTMTATVSSTSAYVRPVDRGRSAGAMPPPIQSLEGWGSRHGFTTRRSLFALAGSISKRGIKGRFFIRRAMQKAQQQTPAIISTVVGNVEAYLRDLSVRY